MNSQSVAMQALTNHLVVLIRQVSTSLPDDIERRLTAALSHEEKGSAAEFALQSILQNVTIASESSTPICQDTGTPLFFVRYPRHYSTREIRASIREAVVEATHAQYLRPNAVDSISGINSGNNLGGEFLPFIHFEETETASLSIDLVLKGGGCENVSRQYSLPDLDLQAGRDLDGVRRAALETVYQAQGRGCSPGFLSIAIGGDRAASYFASKALFLHDIGQRHSDEKIAALETRITHEANQLQIGPMGFGGKTTLLDTHIIGLHRLPASFFVTVSYMCWAFRKGKLTFENEQALFK